MRASLVLLVILGTTHYALAAPNLAANKTLARQYKAQTADSMDIVPFWVSVSSSSDSVINIPDLNGSDAQVHLSLCRAITENVYRAGNLVSDNGHMSCRLATRGYPELHYNFQMLEAVAGTTGWVSVYSEVPRNAIVGGSHPAGFTEYICRAEISTTLIVGNYNPLMRACYIATGQTEHMIRQGIELLVAHIIDKSPQN